MKKITLAAITASAILLSGCFGSFGLTKWAWSLNDGFGSPVKYIPFFFLGGIVGGITMFADAVILNTIEFWTGSNPMAMQDGQIEKQVMEVNGQMVEMTATKGQVAIKTLTGESVDAKLIYNEQENAWYLENEGGLRKFSQL